VSKYFKFVHNVVTSLIAEMALRVVVVSSLFLAHPVHSAVSLDVAMQDNILVESSLLVPRQGPKCSSLDGPFCAQFGASQFRSSSQLPWPLLFKSDMEHSFQMRGLASVIEEDSDVPLPAEQDPVKLDKAVVAHSCSLDFSRLPPWSDTLPLDFAAGLNSEISVTWDGHWRVIGAPRGQRSTWTAAELTGPGSVKFARPVVVSDVLLQASGGPAIIIGYLNREVIWRRRVQPSSVGRSHLWQNYARALWSIDELAILPVSSVTLGALSLSTSRSSAHDISRNSVAATVLSVEASAAKGRARMSYSSISISPSASVMTLQEAWESGFTVGEPQDASSLEAGTPTLEDIQKMFEALQEGMQLPDGVTWAQLESEAERFYEMMSKQIDMKKIRNGWQTVWNSNRFSVLEVCFLKWLENSPSSTEADSLADSTTYIEVPVAMSEQGSEAQSLTDGFFEELLGESTGGVLNGLLKRLSADGESSMTQGLEEALESLVATVAMAKLGNDDRVASLLANVFDEDATEEFTRMQKADEDIAKLQAKRQELIEKQLKLRDAVQQRDELLHQLSDSASDESLADSSFDTSDLNGQNEMASSEYEMEMASSDLISNSDDMNGQNGVASSEEVNNAGVDDSQGTPKSTNIFRLHRQNRVDHEEYEQHQPGAIELDFRQDLDDAAFGNYGRTHHIYDELYVSASRLAVKLAAAMMLVVSGLAAILITRPLRSSCHPVDVVQTEWF